MRLRPIIPTAIQEYETTFTLATTYALLLLLLLLLLFLHFRCCQIKNLVFISEKGCYY